MLGVGDGRHLPVPPSSAAGWAAFRLAIVLPLNFPAVIASLRRRSSGTCT